MMQRAFLACVLLFVVAPASAQKDKIYWTNGKVTTDVRVTGFTWSEIKWTARRGAKETRSADQVAKIECRKVKDAFRRGYGASDKDEAYSQFRIEREKRVKRHDLFIAQFGFLEEAKMLAANGEMAQSFATLDLLVKECPDTGFYPEYFRRRLDYYLGKGKSGAPSAKKVAKDYLTTAETKAWPDGFLSEARYYDVMARVAAGKLDAAAFRRELRGLSSSTEGRFPRVANRVNLQMAEQLRHEKNLAEAKKIYQRLLEQGGLDLQTRAGALLGMGRTLFAEGDPTHREPYRDALLSFLRVYIETDGAPDAMRAEALYYASQACDKWHGPDSAVMSRRLRGYLRRDFADSAWAKR